jgi:O-antigen/teichoic acid export membrane protein
MKPSDASSRHQAVSVADVVELAPAEELRFWRSQIWWRRTRHAAVAIWLGTGLAFAGTVVMARGLGVERYGAVVLAVSVVSVVASLLDLTLEEAVVHYGFRALTDGDPNGVRSLLRMALFVDICIGLAVFALIVIGADLAARLAAGDRLDPTLIQLAALGTLAQTVDGTTGAALLLVRRPDLRGWAMAVSSLFRLPLIGLALAAGGGPDDVLLGIAVATFVGALFQATMAWHAVHKTLRGEKGTSNGKPTLRTLLRFSLHSSFTTTVLGVRSALVEAIVGRILGLRAVGILDVAHFPVSVAAVATAPARLAIFPEQARLSSRGATAELRESLKLHTQAGLAIGIPVAALGWFLLPAIISGVYSDRFIDAVGPARILLIAAVVHLATGWSKTFAAVIGRPELRTRVSLFELTLLVLLLMTIGRSGAGAAATALAIGVTLTGAIWVLLAARLTNSSAPQGAPR